MVNRGELAYVVLNLYPYAPGHLMVCPYRHLADYTDVTDEELVEIGALTRTAMRVIREVSHAEGFNIGMNQGAAGGAGIPAHLHQHVVPRWVGRRNFMPIIGRTKTLPELLHETRALLAGAWGGAGPSRGRPPRGLLLLAWILSDSVSVWPLSRFSARFSLMDFPDFSDMPWRGDLSLIAAPCESVA